MTRSIEFRPEVEDDIASAYDWYNSQDDSLGRGFLRELQAALDRILWNPHTYAIVHRNSRSARLHRYPYVVHYVVKTDTIEVFAVIHASRDPSNWQGRLGPG